MSSVRTWTASVRVRPPAERTGRWLSRALAPEAAREVPRAKASVRELEDGAVEIEVEAADAGAMRAALNTYLGWVHLALATLSAAEAQP